MKYFNLTITLFAGLLLASCSQPPVPKDSYYRLQAGPPTKVFAAPLFSGTVQVQRFLADGLMANRPIAHSFLENPNKLSEYHYHFWTEHPPVMLRDQLVDYLRAAKAADRVVTPELRVSSDFVISGKIRRFEHVRGNSNTMVVELELSVRRFRSDELLFIGTYGVKTPVSSSDVASAVKAANLSVREIFTRFLSDIASKKQKN